MIDNQYLASDLRIRGNTIEVVSCICTIIKNFIADADVTLISKEDLSTLIMKFIIDTIDPDGKIYNSISTISSIKIKSNGEIEDE